MIKLKCTRCGSTYPAPVEDWVTCGKCGFSAFVGTKAPVKVEGEGAGETAKPEGEAVEPEV